MSVQASRSAGVEVQETAVRLGGVAKADRAPDAEGGLADRRTAVFVHADQFRRQGGDRDRRRADDAGTEAQSEPVRVDRFELLPAVFACRRSSPALSSIACRRVGRCWRWPGLGVDPVPDDGAAWVRDVVACRIALGAGEGPAAPVALHSAYKWFPNEQRTLPTAVIMQGGGIGIMVALPLLNWVIVHYSWHWAFGVLGIAGLVWTAAWLVLGREGSLAPRRRRNGAVPTPSGSATDDWCSARRSLASWCAAFGGPMGLVAGAVLAGGVSDQGAWPGAGLDRLVGRASGGCQRGRYDRRRLVFAAPARPAGHRAGWRADYPGRRLRRAGRRGAGDYAVSAGYAHQDRA